MITTPEIILIGSCLILVWKLSDAITTIWAEKVNAKIRKEEMERNKKIAEDTIKKLQKANIPTEVKLADAAEIRKYTG